MMITFVNLAFCRVTCLLEVVVGTSYRSYVNDQLKTIARLVYSSKYSRGGHSGTQGGRTLVTYFAEEGVFFEDLRMSAIL